MDGGLAERIMLAVGERVVGSRSLSGGCVGDVRLVELESGGRVVVKINPGAERGGEGGGLAIEGRMLQFLKERSAVPVPRVYMCEADLLVMEYIEHDGRGGASAEIHAAELLAALHEVRPDPARDGGSGFGFNDYTVIGGLQQANGWRDSWVMFFAEHRLVNMARQAHGVGRIDGALLSRVERFAERVGGVVDEPGAPSLVHGDIWSGNVLFDRGRVVALIDPAIYFGHAEIELAFIGMFSTFGEVFYERYHEIRPIAPGFFEQRLAIYNLFPLLVHARLFGGSYVGQVERTLSRFGA